MKHTVYWKKAGRPRAKVRRGWGCNGLFQNNKCVMQTCARTFVLFIYIYIHTKTHIHTCTHTHTCAASTASEKAGRTTVSTTRRKRSCAKSIYNCGCKYMRYQQPVKHKVHVETFTHSLVFFELLFAYSSNSPIAAYKLNLRALHPRDWRTSCAIAPIRPAWPWIATSSNISA